MAGRLCCGNRAGVLRPCLVLAAAVVLIVCPAAGAHDLDGSTLCPTDPGAAPGGYSDEASELRELRREQIAACIVLLEQVHDNGHELADVLAEAESLDDAVAGVLTAAESIESAYSPGPVPVSIEGQPTTPLAVEDATSHASIDAAGQSQREAIWFLVGLAVSLFAGYALYRQVFPRA